MATRFQILNSAVCTPPLPTKARVTSKRMSTPQKTKRFSVDQELKLQSAYLCYHLFYYILKEEGIRMNGYASNDEHAPPPKDMPCLTGVEFQDAYETIKRNCMHMRSQHRDEMLSLVKTLDIRDSKLQSNFTQVASTIIDGEIRWGRIVALFVFTAMLAVRLHSEGQQQKIEGLPQWLVMFINDNVSEWLQQTPGGWVRSLFRIMKCCTVQYCLAWILLGAIGHDINCLSIIMPTRNVECTAIVFAWGRTLGMFTAMLTMGAL